MGEHQAERRDAGNTDPEHLSVDLDDDELAEVLNLLAEQDEIRDNRRAWQEQQLQQRSGAPRGVL